MSAFFRRVFKFAATPVTKKTFAAIATTSATSSALFFLTNNNNLKIHAKEHTAPAPPANNNQITLYQYDVCPYCNKVKAILDYAKIPYAAVEVNPLTKKETKFTTYKKVPILVMDGEELHESSEIMKIIKDRKQLNPKQTEAARVEEEIWLKWVDDYFVHLLSPNIYRTMDEAFEAFDYILDSCGEWGTVETYAARYVGAIAMYGIGKKLKKKHNIEDERAALYEACNKWITAVGNRKMMGGNQPNLADLAIFGTLRAIHDMSTFKDITVHTPIINWYNNVAECVGVSQRLNPISKSK